MESNAIDGAVSTNEGLAENVNVPLVDVSPVELPVIPAPQSEPTSPVPEVQAHVETEHTAQGHKEKKHRKSTAPHLPNINRNIEWVRSFDQQHNIYYYNTTTGESTWLAPCSHCQKAADKWCLDCKLSYCDHDFSKRHKKDETLKHKWQFKEVLDAAQLPPGEEYCIACMRKAAFKICLDCWDPYCLTCFGLVHHVGALKMHKSMPYARAKLGWMTVLQHGNAPDVYVHGETKEIRTDKPDELLSDFEKITIENTKNFREATIEHKARIEVLLAELVVVEKERDVAVVEASKAMQALHAKEAEREKAAHGEAMSSKSKKKS